METSNLEKTLLSNINDLIELENDPDDIKDFIISKFFNKDLNYNILRDPINDFEKLEDADDKTCFKLITDILKILGKNGFPAELDKSKTLDTKINKPKRTIIKYLIEKTKNKIIDDIQYKKGKDFLSDLKRKISGITDIEKKKQTLSYVKDLILPSIIKHIKNIENDDIMSNLNENGVEIIKQYKQGDVVRYKRDEYNDKKPIGEQPENVAEGVIKNITDDKVIIFNKYLNKEIQKTKDDIIERADKKGPDDKKLSELLNKVNKDSLKKIYKYAEFLENQEKTQTKK